MIAFELPPVSAAAALRVVRALGSHRYVASRLHLVHAFAIASAPRDAVGLEEGREWASRVLADPDIENDSRDERLYRASTEAEVIVVLDAFWSPGKAAEAARAELRAWLARSGLPESEATPFDEAAEEDIHPLLVDAGWELLPLASLDVERHKGAIQWFGAPIDFEVACFEEESAIPRPTYLQELPGIGSAELLRGADEWGDLASPLTLWLAGNERYHEYVLTGVQRAARLT